jgi:splicing suppressor protein 51
MEAIRVRCKKSATQRSQPLKKKHHKRAKPAKPAKRKNATYCSSDCKNADWLTEIQQLWERQGHKFCDRGASASGSSPPPTPPNPQLHQNNDASSFLARTSSFLARTSSFLARISSFLARIYEDSPQTISDQKDFYRYLIDCYRMHVEDEYTWGGELTGLYAGKDPLIGFRKFLDLAEREGTVLPKWWNKEKRAECEKLGMIAGEWSYLRFAVEKSDIQEHYKDPKMPMELRALAARIYGR